VCFKQIIGKEQLKPHGENLQNVNDVISYLQRSMNQPHAAYEGVRKRVGQTFWKVKEGDFDRT
jgi:hypothetical protein